MHGKFYRVSQEFLRLPTPLRALIVVLMALLVAAGDFLTPSYISFIGYYLIPIFLSIWYFTCSWVFAVVFAISLLSRIYVVDIAVTSGRPLWQNALSVGSIVLAFSIFSLLVKMLKKYVLHVEENGDKDPLTGLRNRRSFLSLAEYELQRRNRIRYPLTVAMMDLDCFKALNDTQGHDAGDRLLMAFSECLVTSLRNVDIIGRLGGDEFGLVLPNTTYEQTKLVLDRLQSHIKPVLDSFGCDGLGCSVGAVNVKAESFGSEINDLLKRADALMYQVKRTMKNSVLVEQE